MADQVRVGVIGTSWYADLVHLPNLKSHPRVDLAALCGRTLARAQELAHKYDIPKADDFDAPSPPKGSSAQ